MRSCRPGRGLNFHAFSRFAPSDLLRRETFHDGRTDSLPRRYRDAEPRRERDHRSDHRRDDPRERDHCEALRACGAGLACQDQRRCRRYVGNPPEPPARTGAGPVRECGHAFGHRALRAGARRTPEGPRLDPSRHGDEGARRRGRQAARPRGADPGLRLRHRAGLPQSRRQGLPGQHEAAGGGHLRAGSGEGRGLPEHAGARWGGEIGDG